MARMPKPWFWKARKAWYVTIDGTRHMLARDKGDALTRFHQLMAEPQKRLVRSDSLTAILDVYLEWCQKHRSPHTYEWYRYRLERFVQTYPQMRTHELRPYHVQQWLDEMDLSSGSKRNYCRSIKRAMRWAKRQGYIDVNPIGEMEEPRCGKRDVVVSAADFNRILEVTVDETFRDLLVTTWETGCRPQESLRVEARHVDLSANRWLFPQTEAKGGLPRIVYLSEKAVEITRRLAAKYPTGKLFRNVRGVAWTTGAVNNAFQRIRHRIGQAIVDSEGLDVSEMEIRQFMTGLSPTCLSKGKRIQKRERDLYVEARRKLRLRLAESKAPKYSLYTLRHSWATHALERGVDALTVAVLMGHRDPSTLAKVYQHLSQNPDYMLEQARKAAG